MGRLRSCRLLVWLLCFSFAGQVLVAEVVPSDSQPMTPEPTIVRDVVPSDSQPRTIVVPGITREVVPSDSQPMVPITTPPVHLLVGEVAVGVSLLIAYGPQIIALAATVATLAAAIATVVNTSRASLHLVKSIGNRLQRMLQLLLGPLSFSTGVAKDGVDQLSGHLLKVAQFVSKSMMAPTSDVQAKIDQSLGITRDLESLTQRGLALSRSMQNETATTKVDLKRIVAGGEVQLFRDRTLLVADRLQEQADSAAAAFTDTLGNVKSTADTLEHLQTRIERALVESGLSANQASLQDLGLSGADLGKQIVTARRSTMQSKRSLSASQRKVGGLHTQIMDLLTDMKTELELYALEHGVGYHQLRDLMRSPSFKASVAAPTAMASSAGKPGIQANQADCSRDLSTHIGFMIDELGKMSNAAQKRLIGQEQQKAEARATVGEGRGKDTEALYQKMNAAYRSYISIMSREPANESGIRQARESYESLQAEYQKVSLR